MTISHDIMLHDAYWNMDCAYVGATCYQLAPRLCPATTAGKEGCDCRGAECAKVCRRATPRDPEARLIHYDGDNKHAEAGHHRARKARDVYGYASNPDRLIDDRFACAWTLRTGLHPANADERKLFPASFAALRQRFPDLRIGEVLGDAALGYDDCLHLIWQAGALRMIAIRAAQGDTDLAVSAPRVTTPMAIPSASTATRCDPMGMTTNAVAPSGAARRPVSHRRPRPRTPRSGLPLGGTHPPTRPGRQRRSLLPRHP